MPVMEAFGKQLGGGGSRPSPRWLRKTQDDADRYRRVATQLDSAAQELSAVEGGGLLIKFAYDLRKQAQEIEKWLPSDAGR